MNRPSPADARVKPPDTEIRGGFGSGRMSSVGLPLDRSLDFRGSVGRLLRRMGPERLRLVLVVGLAVASVVLVVLGPAILGHATNLIVEGVQEGGIDFGALHRTLLLAVVLYALSAGLAWLQAYTLAGVVNGQTGWGRAGESWRFMEALKELGGEDWFNLGDTDLATHAVRSARLEAGESLTAIVAGMARRLGVEATILPEPSRASSAKVGGAQMLMPCFL